MTLGELVLQYMKENNLSQREFAKKCGDVSHGYISLVITGVNPRTGKPAIPKLDKLSAIAKGMGMTLQELFDAVDDMPVELGQAPAKQNTLPKPHEDDQDRLEALHQDPRLRLLFDRVRKLSDEDIEWVNGFVSRILKERDEQ